MKKIFNYLYILIIVSIVNILNCNAECSYQERKDLLNDAKSVDIYYELETKKENVPFINSETGMEETEEMDIEYFKFYVRNVPNNLYVEVTNDIDGKTFYIDEENIKDGVYTFDVDNLNKLGNYNFTFYSNNSNCLGYKIYTEKVIKPKYNYVYDSDICKEDRLIDNEYCKKYVSKDFNLREDQILDQLNLLLNEKKDLEKSQNIFIKYWYVFAIIFGGVLLAYVIILINKRRSRL